MKSILFSRNRKITAVLTAVALMAGTVDTGMQAWAVEPDGIVAEADGPDQEQTDGSVSENAPEICTVSDISLDEAEPKAVTITGVSVSNKKYDGQPVECNNSGIKVQEQESGEDVTATLQDKLIYTYTGTKRNGEEYSETDTAPKDAGTYQLTVSVPEENGDYTGSSDPVPFTISPRTLLIKPDDVSLVMGDPVPEKYTYRLSGDGFLDGETLDAEPTVTCEIINTNTPGEYDITASGADAGNNYDIQYETGVLTVSEPEPVKAKLIRIPSPADVWNVPNGMSLDRIPLPETVTIVTEDVNAAPDEKGETTVKAAVNWERAPIKGTTYIPDKTESQTFVVGGTVELPELVYAEEDMSLAVEITVHVREKMISDAGAVADPVASIQSGSAVKKGTAVELRCDTEDARIYYTLDGTTPTRNSNCYQASSPITINAYTVIRAFAVKDGYKDSDQVRFSYSVISGSAAGGEDSDGEDDEPEPEVPGEDIPAGGVIPQKVWVAGFTDSYVYTGKAIKPVFRVYDHKTLLTQNKDYTISYKNNTNAADSSSSAAPQVVITFKGNYEGKLVMPFTITPKSLEDEDVYADDIALLYNKKAQKPTPVVTWNGKKLVNKKDYSLPDTSYTEPGSHTVTVTGKGNYTGEIRFVFTIIGENGVPVSKLTVGKIADQVYTGSEIKPKLNVKYKGTALIENQNYEVTYQNNTAVGTATAVIKGKGRYAGTKKVNFKIKAVASLAKAKAEIAFQTPPVYTGNEIRPDSETVSLTYTNAAGEKISGELKPGVDYETAYQNNIKAGTATIIYTGKGAFNGKLKKTFKITAKEMQSDGIKISLDPFYRYTKGGCKPEPAVYFGDRALTSGTDYTLSYQQNTAAGKTATVLVKGKGNFRGTVSKTFLVTAGDIGQVQVSAADRFYKNRSNLYKTTVKLTDVNGKTLSVGKDYDKNIVYTYEKVAFAEGFTKKAGDPVDKSDIIPAGTLIRVTVKGSGNYTGDVSGTYRIAQQNISGAKVKIPVQTYTGRQIKPSASQMEVTVGGQILSPGDYEIVGYSNNIKKGTAKVTIHGLGNYGGTRTATFKIKGKGIS